MSCPKPSELRKSENQKIPITCSQVNKNTELANLVVQNQTGPFKVKRSVTGKKEVTKDNF